MAHTATNVRRAAAGLFNRSSAVPLTAGTRVHDAPSPATEANSINSAGDFMEA